MRSVDKMDIERVGADDLHTRELRDACLRSAASLLGFSSQEMLENFVKATEGFALANGSELVTFVRQWISQRNSETWTDEYDKWNIVRDKAFWSRPIRPLPPQVLGSSAKGWVAGDGVLKTQSIPKWEAQFEAIRKLNTAATYMDQLFSVEQGGWARAYQALIGSSIAGTDGASNIANAIDSIDSLCLAASKWGHDAASEVGQAEFADVAAVLDRAFSRDYLSGYMQDYVRALASPPGRESNNPYASAALPLTVLAWLNATRLSPESSDHLHWSAIWIMYLQRKPPSKAMLAPDQFSGVWARQARDMLEVAMDELMITGQGVRGSANAGLYVMKALTFGNTSMDIADTEPSLLQTRNALGVWSKTFCGVGSATQPTQRQRQDEKIVDIYRSVQAVLSDCVKILTSNWEPKSRGFPDHWTERMKNAPMFTLAKEMVEGVSRGDGVAVIAICDSMRRQTAPGSSVQEWVKAIQSSLADEIATLFGRPLIEIPPVVGKMEAAWREACAQSKTAASGMLHNSMEYESAFLVLEKMVTTNALTGPSVDCYNWLVKARAPTMVDPPFIVSEQLEQNCFLVLKYVEDAATSQYTREMATIRAIIDDRSVHDLDGPGVAAKIEEYSNVLKHLKETILPFAKSVTSALGRAVHKIDSLASGTLSTPRHYQCVGMFPEYYHVNGAYYRPIMGKCITH